MIDSAPPPILLVGSGRSGTTWLAEVIDHDRRHRLLFEPLHGRKVAEVAHFVFHSQYLPAACRDPRFVDPLRAILRGDVHHPWVNRRRGPPGARLLIKTIRTHLMLGWLQAHAPAAPLVFLLRHPCAVAASRVQLGWGTHLEEMLGQPDLVARYLAPVEARLRGLTDPFLQHVATWAIENAVALEQLRQPVHVVHYEHLCADFGDELARLFAFIGRPAPGSTAALRDRPSQLVAEHSAVVTGGDRVTAWRDRCTPEQIERAVEVLTWFDLDRVYTADSLPRTHGSALVGA